MLTGETGAGKSLIAGALSLLTGAKADRQAIREGEDLAFVEGVFDLAATPAMMTRAAGLGIRLGPDGMLVLRREVRREGRGRVLINGLVSSLSLLEQIGADLLSIQSQDQQRQLARPAFAGEFLDTVLAHGDLLAAVASARDLFLDTEVRLAERVGEESFAQEQHDMWEFQYRELSGAGLDATEEAALAEKLALGRNARALIEAAGKAREGLTEGAVNARQLLGSAEAALAPLSDQSTRLQEILDLVRDAEAAVGEAATGLERFLDGIDTDPGLLDELEERKALYEDLRRKYNRDVEGLLELEQTLKVRLGRQQSAAAELAELRSLREEARGHLAEAAQRLRRSREQQARTVAARAVEAIRPLALPALELVFSIEPDSDPAGPVEIDGVRCRVTAKGADRIALLARTNRGEAHGEVARIASGGEKSRIFLGLSVMMGHGDHRPLLLFDEIDAGLGMDNAVPVAELLGRLAAGGQVVCITHLPTVAARGSSHVRVFKAEAGGRTALRVEPVTGEKRIQEIARLLGGEESGIEGGRENQVAYARQLLGTGRRRANAG